MQEIHSIEAGFIFSGGVGGGGGGGDRRLPHHHHHHHQALKCPRCDSLNTKFCYYNNYNLSQPRHFCKSCRRYWTKGGILRNVPVGGGCRKAKRTKTKPSSKAASALPHPEQQHSEQAEANSHSSSESSSLTATNSIAAVTDNSNNGHAGGTAEAVSAVSEPKLYGSPDNLGLEPGSDCGIFSGIGSFTSLIISSNNETPSFDFDKDITEGLLDQSVMGSRSEDGFGALDWQGDRDQGLFDLPNDVDKTYWNQAQWTDQDHPNLYLP
ncbi:hypothetical protein V6N13_123375 [Hibiscus sabdariffa]|uniref:Dof zinc finger protein n=1 Tax=Hibiscus sabdariffa TaxID=183260 RepID=A0ABR2AXH5_9ROSI